MGRKQNTRKGNTVHRLRSGSNIPAASIFAAVNPLEPERIMTSTQVVSTPRRRGRPRKSRSQFPGTVITFNSRPRLMVGDVVELCRGCLPGNIGKLGVVTGFREDGEVSIEPLGELFITNDGSLSDDSYTKPENLYRRSRDLAKRRSA